MNTVFHICLGVADEFVRVFVLQLAIALVLIRVICSFPKWGFGNANAAGKLCFAVKGGDPTPTIFARIASISIAHMARGSIVAGDFFGITAQKIGALTLGTKVVTFINAANNVSLDLTNNDFHAVDFA